MLRDRHRGHQLAAVKDGLFGLRLCALEEVSGQLTVEPDDSRGIGRAAWAAEHDVAATLVGVSQVLGVLTRLRDVDLVALRESCDEGRRAALELGGRTLEHGSSICASCRSVLAGEFIIPRPFACCTSRRGRAVTLSASERCFA